MTLTLVATITTTPTNATPITRIEQAHTYCTHSHTRLTGVTFRIWLIVSIGDGAASGFCGSAGLPLALGRNNVVRVLLFLDAETGAAYAGFPSIITKPLTTFGTKGSNQLFLTLSFVFFSPASLSFHTLSNTLWRSPSTPSGLSSGPFPTARVA